jgi:hypothetical protein
MQRHNGHIRRAAFLAALLLCSGVITTNLSAADTIDALTGQTVGVLPFANYTGTSHAVTTIVPLIYRELYQHGIDYITSDSLRPTLRQHRIRSVGKIGGDDARSIKESTGATILLTGSLDVYREEGNPDVAISLRFIDIEQMKVMAALSIAATGEDFAGLFGVGRLSSAEEVAERIVKRIFEQLRKSMDKAAHRPQDEKARHRLAVVTFDNTTDTRYAGEIVSGILLSGLVQDGFEVLEPGLVYEMMLHDQVVLRGEIRLQLLRKLADRYDLDFLITGRVEGFSPQRGSVEETHPEFEFGARQLDASTGKVLATYDGSTTGADSETILGLGRCHSLGELVARSLKGLRETIRKESEKRFE